MTENGFEYVDLGLLSGTMWATCNVGATKPEDEGLLFQWGRVDGYKYGDENHKFGTNEQNVKDTGSKFIPLTPSGKLYKTNELLNLKDDAAHINMGGKWRMPTKDDLEELLNNTIHKVKTINYLKGMLFTSNINKRQLFIPFMQGYWYNGTWYSLDKSYASIWSSRVYVFVDDAYKLYCGLSGNAYVNNLRRSSAFSVRGVFKK